MLLALSANSFRGIANDAAKDQLGADSESFVFCSFNWTEYFNMHFCFQGFSERRKDVRGQIV
jgi:hypothetical protein